MILEFRLNFLPLYHGRDKNHISIRTSKYWRKSWHGSIELKLKLPQSKFRNVITVETTINNKGSEISKHVLFWLFTSSSSCLSYCWLLWYKGRCKINLSSRNWKAFHLLTFLKQFASLCSSCFRNKSPSAGLVLSPERDERVLFLFKWHLPGQRQQREETRQS